MTRPLACIALFLIAAAVAAETLDNAAIVRLTSAGLSTEIVLLKIEQSDGRFDVSTDALVELKSAGVADTVIKAMMLKRSTGRGESPSSIPSPSPVSTPSRIENGCTQVMLYALGNNGWAWAPASVCVSVSELSVDEQSFPYASLTVQCVEPESRLTLLGATSTGDATWRFSDGKESFQLRGKPEEIGALTTAVAAAAPAARHGKCSEGELRALLRAGTVR